MEDQDIIGHLIEMEHQAAGLLLDAQVEADKRTASAHAKADVVFKTAYEGIISEQEKRMTAETTKIDTKKKFDFSAFQKKLEERPQDAAGLAVLLDSLLFGK